MTGHHPETDYPAQRAAMVEQQLRARGIHDGRVLAAMAEVPRECFVPDGAPGAAYADSPQPLAAGQTVSQPYIVALMIEALALAGPERVLDVGTGSGYAAAVLSRLAAEVYGIERLPELVAYARERLAAQGYTNVQLRQGDGTLGWPEQAPFDAIMVAAAGPVIPAALRSQLTPGGRLVMPVGPRDGIQTLIRLVRRSETAYLRESLGDVRFVPLIGATGWPAVTK